MATTGHAKATKAHGEKKRKKMNTPKQQEFLLRNKLLKGKDTTHREHMYLKLYPWKTRLALAEHLKSSEVYNQDGIIALCKPYGVAQFGKCDKENSTGIQGVHTGGWSVLPDDLPGVMDALPDLRLMYGEPELQVVKSTERWSSGLIILSTSPKITENVQKCWRRSKTSEEAQLTFWAVTVGLPKPVSDATKIGIKTECVENMGNVPVLVKNYSQASLKRGEVRLSVVEHQALAFNKDTQAGLVQVKTQTTKHHFLRVWLAHSYSPALGDNLFSGRVHTISGKRIHVSPHNLVSYEPQVLPDSFYSKLQLPPRKTELIPCHLHLSQVQLSKFGKEKSDLIISAPPPEYFMWTCKQLSLMSENDVDEQNELRINS
ncbi:hypothetical protein Pcinc_013199 [Petrolisthes cinctipes]|uniref:Pseudouridine synthase RsuA/RluA-like domain-containing protein n=1 Tax=Petrolisthes cinctipes TaxID=88211 RepID=A0AAE1FZD2_PETCI|nr:hypothetical protein Pcinc_013199 [Petrolisthes cinctipes]